jgi:Glu-tRNA(Gln) amidotransferase subunit E-like FAD-binding protein
MEMPNDIFEAALSLIPVQKAPHYAWDLHKNSAKRNLKAKMYLNRVKASLEAELIDKLLSSLDIPDKEIDKLWSDEIEDRINAYENGEIKSVSLEKVLEKYR